ncbi:hypothetical protein BC834DRAFT_969116 [Gloeopeniophorella convolvens]|nr:hypothetical protein BC834DRAFT_969116 [Gloeopeniophorella convolvens]
MTDNSEVPPTLLSALQETPMPENISAPGLHPFSISSEKTVAFLHTLIDNLGRLSHSATLHSATVVNDPKTVSLLRQQSAGQHVLHLSRTQVAQTVTAAQERRRAERGYDGLADDSSAISRISAWSSAAGMQAFPEAAAGTLVLGGKVLVLDVALLPEPSVHATFAGSTEGRDSPAMDAFFSRLVRSVARGGDGRKLRDALEYLMRLDELAANDPAPDAGARWFGEVDVLAKKLAEFTQAEAAYLAQHTPGQTSIPLDVLLLRGHALGIPYLHSPTICFLVYLSPRIYLSLKRCAPTTPPLQFPSFDIPPLHLHTCLSVHPPPIGVTRAVLNCVQLTAPAEPPPPSPGSMLSARPSFPLAPQATSFEHQFPLPSGIHAGKYGWVLAFARGVVMSQSRMLEIARVVRPHEQLPFADPAAGLQFATGSWVDMLLNPDGPMPMERYTATYASPTGLHPPLRLTLTTPDEPGFLLERVQVYNMQEVWAVLEIVRDQCWLNEILSGCAWMPEASSAPPVADDAGAPDAATEDELRALLAGTYTPRSIPVNAYVGSSAVMLTFPERPPMPGMVSVSVVLNGAAGATVQVQGAMGAEIQTSALEEAVRRGGALGLPGRVWAASQAVA